MTVDKQAVGIENVLSLAAYPPVCLVFLLVAINDRFGRTTLRMVPQGLEFGLNPLREFALPVAHQARVPFPADRERRVCQIGAAYDGPAGTALAEEIGLGVKAVAAAGFCAVDADRHIAEAHQAAYGPRLGKAQIVRREHAARDAPFLKLQKGLQQGGEAALGDEGHGDVKGVAGSELLLYVVEQLVLATDIAEQTGAQGLFGRRLRVQKGCPEALGEPLGQGSAHDHALRVLHLKEWGLVFMLARLQRNVLSCKWSARLSTGPEIPRALGPAA